MKIAVISDIHGNAIALEAALTDIRQKGADQIVCLGDAIQGGPQPVEAAARLRALACPVVMGNADDWLLTGKETGAEAMSEERRKMMDAVRAWQLAQLSETDTTHIRSFQPLVEIPLPNGQTLTCYHGSPNSYDDIILPDTPDEVARVYLQPDDRRIYCGGHTHLQFIRHFGRTFHLNPGSIGFAYRHDQPEDRFRYDSWAEYALLSIDGGSLGLEFRRVPYDAQALIEAYRSSGRPYADQVIAQYGG